jgi:hypothetical protein
MKMVFTLICIVATLAMTEWVVAQHILFERRFVFD